MTEAILPHRITDGTARDRRLAPALAEGYVRPAERSLSDHLALLAAIAGQIRFHDATNRPAGTWAKLFAQEPAAMMSELLALGPEDARARFAERAACDPEGAARELRDLARRVSLWLGRAASRGRDRFGAQIDAIAARPELLRLVETLAAAEETTPERLAELTRESLAAGRRPAADAIERARAARQALLDAQEQLLNIVAALRPMVEETLDVRLGSGRIDPSLGLLLANVGMLEEVEAVVNRFTSRHTAFYYREVLGLAPRPAGAEAAHLRFAPGALPIHLPAGTELVARMTGVPEPARFRLSEGLRVAPVKVAEALGLRFHRDPLISPQAAMGFVSGVSLARIPTAGDDAVRADPPRLFGAGGGAPADMGLEIASPMLRLAGGRRRIELRLVLTRRGDAEATRTGAGATHEAVLAELQADPALAALFGLDDPDTSGKTLAEWRAALGAAEGTPAAQLHHALLLHAAAPAQVEAIYGRVVRAGLVEGTPWPAGDFRDALLSGIEAHLGGPEAARVAARIFDHGRDEVFQTLLHDAFEVTLSAETGPLAVGAARIAPNAVEDGPGFTLSLQLGEAAPAIVPPPGAVSPVLGFRMAPQGRFCPFSLFEPYALESIVIETRVEGLTRLTAFSDDGPLNMAQPVLPFGARPKDGAAFLVGAPELAAKPVLRVGLDVVWSDLPSDPGGFEDYYRSYGETFHAPDPKIGLAYLAGDGWRDLPGGQSHPMVGRIAPGGPLRARQRFEGSVPGRVLPPRTGITAEDFRQRSTIRAGLFGLTLDCPGDAFGHEAYPAALAEAMRPGFLRTRRRGIPPAPWTPRIASAALDYAARDTILLGTPQAARPGERVVQIGPFGRQEIFPARSRPGMGLFPARLADGTLFLRVAGPTATGPVSLLFEMAQGSHRRRSFRPEPVRWHYLTASGWQPLPSWSLATDTTDGLMRTGIVTIDVPDEDVVLSGGEMPGEGVWLAVSADHHLDAFPRLASLGANGARAERIGLPEADAPALPLRWSLDPPVAGLGAIAQVGATLGGTPPETDPAFRARVSERLRHRARAVTAWDVERLVLDAFPEVWKAKCLPAYDQRLRAPRPGAMTVVVVPAAPEDAAAVPSRPAMFDVLTLRRIERFLAGRLSAFAEAEVRNPGYERLQVRAKVGFTAGSDESGTALRRLKLDISRFLSVWTAAAPMDGFGWSLNLNDVAAFVTGLDYVRFLTEFSILQLVADDAGQHRLHDTARSGGGGDEAGNGAAILAAREPWGLALPMADHWITPLFERRSETPRATGIGGLAIGETLVVDMRETA